MTASMRRTALLSLLLLSTATAAAAAPAAPVGVPQLTTDPAAVQPGTTLTLEGRGFPRNVHIALLAGPPNGEPTRIGGARTGTRGRFTATIHVRPSAAAGRFVALACHDGCDVKASVPFRILAP